MAALKTPLQAFAETVKRYGSEVAMVQPIGGGRVKEYTWNEVRDNALRIASYLRSLEFPPQSHIALMSKNCAEWIIADLGIWLAGHIGIPLYPTLTSGSVRQILEHSEARALFVGKLDVWEEARLGVPDDLHCIAFSLSPDSARQQYITIPDIVQQHSPLSDPADPEPEQLATIIYTSGTTGMPKGVMQNFHNFAVIGNNLGTVNEMSQKDRMISYLPLSHIAERDAVEISMLYMGQKIFFADTLETFAEDIKRARPTIFFAVPRIWNKFYQKVHEAMPPQKLNRLLKIPLLNRVIKKKLLGAMGLDACRIAMSGAASLSPEVIHWYNRLGLEILEVYGMTENMAWSHTTRSGDQKVGWVGLPNEGVACRIADNGEIQIRSPGNMLGYYKEPELTREAFTEDGWLKTGDVGEIDAAGRLRITGRVKEIFKTEKGKYVAPAPIENRLVSFPGLEQACVTGVGLPQPLVLVNLSPEEAEQVRLGGREKLTTDLEALLKRVNQELDQHERLTTLIVVSEPWTTENGILTPTLKLKRDAIEKLYAERILQWANTKGVVWG